MFEFATLRKPAQDAFPMHTPDTLHAEAERLRTAFWKAYDNTTPPPPLNADDLTRAWLAVAMASLDGRAPAPVAADDPTEGGKYRLLEVGEIRQSGDTFRDRYDPTDDWDPMILTIGHPISHANAERFIYRRPVAGKEAAK